MAWDLCPGPPARVHACLRIAQTDTVCHRKRPEKKRLSPAGMQWRVGRRAMALVAALAPACASCLSHGRVGPDVLQNHQMSPAARRIDVRCEAGYLQAGPSTPGATWMKPIKVSLLQVGRRFALQDQGNPNLAIALSQAALLVMAALVLPFFSTNPRLAAASSVGWLALLPGFSVTALDHAHRDKELTHQLLPAGSSKQPFFSR